MFRKIIAGTAVAGALTFGMAGIAGASTAPTGAGVATGTNGPAINSSTTVCSLLPRIEARVHEVEGKLAADLPKAQAREAKAKAAGHTKLADAIANRIARIQDRVSKVNARLTKIEATCGTAGSAGVSG